MLNFCHLKLVQILSPGMYGGRGNSWRAGEVSSSKGWGGGQYTGRENLEQFPTTESLAWASVNNSYSLICTFLGLQSGQTKNDDSAFCSKWCLVYAPVHQN
jgi:hypothetical protein